MPEVNLINPNERVQKPARLQLYLATAAPFNAVGDGITDNTSAIQSALDKAASDGGGIVFLPPGKYKVTGHLVVPTGVELKGSLDLRTCPGTPGSTLEVYADRNNENGTPFLKLQERSGIRGLIFNYPEQLSTDLPDNIGKYPYTIQGLGKDIYILNIGFIAAYKGIDLFTNKCDNFYVDCLGGHTFKVATKVGGNSENGLLANWQFNVIYYAVGYSYRFGSWPNSIENTVAKETCYDYALNQLDFLVVDDCKNLTLYNNFGYGSQRGTVFTSSSGTGASGVALGHASDGARRGFCFESVAPDGFSLINSQIVALRKDANDDTSCYLETTPSLEGKGSVSMYSCNYWGATNKALDLKGGTLNLYLSNFVNTGETGFARIANNAKLNISNAVIRPRNPLLSGTINNVSVSSSVTNNDGFSTQNVALWKNNLPFYSGFKSDAVSSRNGWIASSSVDNAEANLTLDGNASTRWTSGRQIDFSEAWFMVDMKEAWKFNTLILDHTQSANDFPESFDVYVSNDGVDWGSSIYSGQGIGGGTIVIPFADQTARYARIVLHANEKTQHWSIHEFYALYIENDPVSSVHNISYKQENNLVEISNNKLYINGLSGISAVSIYNMSGQLVVPSTKVESSLNLNLSQGIYIVIIKNEDRFYTQKIRI